MSFDNSYTAVTGATYQASDYNTHTKGNFASVWVGTTAGDMDYYTSATAKSRLAKPASLGFLQSDNAGVPSWFTGGSALQYLRKNSGNTAFEWSALSALIPNFTKRQGGSSTIFTAPGTTNYDQASPILQFGYVNVTVSTNGYATQAVTYPTAFTKRPAIFLTGEIAASTSYTWSFGHRDDTTSGFTIQLKFANSAMTGTWAIGWLAIGE